MEKYYPKSIDELSSEDYRGLLELKDLVSPILSAYPEYDTLWHTFRFYRAKKFDVADAERMVRSFVEFRNQADMNRIMNRDHSEYEELEQAVDSGRYGVDYHGRPIVIERMSSTDHKIIMRSKNEELRFDYFVQRFERLLFIELPIASLAANRKIDKVLVINDLEGVSFSKMFDSKLKAFFKLMVIIGQNNYPELTEQTFIVNVPAMFKGMWTMLQSWFNKKNSTSVTLHNSVPHEKLKEYLDVERLPIFLGGKNTIPLRDNHGPWKEEVEDSKVRKSFFLRNRTPEYNFFYTDEEKDDLGFGDNRPKRLFTTSHNKPEDHGSREVRCFLQNLHKHEK